MPVHSDVFIHKQQFDDSGGHDDNRRNQGKAKLLGDNYQISHLSFSVCHSSSWLQLFKPPIMTSFSLLRNSKLDEFKPKVLDSLSLRLLSHQSIKSHISQSALAWHITSANQHWHGTSSQPISTDMAYTCSLVKTSALETLPHWVVILHGGSLNCCLEV